MFTTNACASAAAKIQLVWFTNDSRKTCAVVRVITKWAMKIVCELCLWAQVVLPLSLHNYLAWYHYQLNKISVQYLTDMTYESNKWSYGLCPATIKLSWTDWISKINHDLVQKVGKIIWNQISDAMKYIQFKEQDKCLRRIKRISVDPIDTLKFNLD